MNARITIFILAIALAAAGCTRKDKKTALSEEDLIQLATQKGDEVSQTTQTVLASKLKQVIESEGIPHALKYCNVNAYPIVDSLEKAYKISIKRASIKTRNPEDAPTPVEASIIDQYLDEIERGETPGVVIKTEEKDILYFKPIILSAALCLRCHGQIGTDILNEHHTIIENLYPEDNATGHKMGDLRGIWSIGFEKKDLAGD